MIISNRRHMLGFSHFGVVKGTKFGCAVITAPEGLFKGCSTLFQAFDSDCWVDAKSGHLVAKAILHPSLSKRQRAEIHDAFLTHLDVLGNAGRDLATAIDEVFAVAKEKGFVVDSINHAHTLAQGRDSNLPDASHNALTQEVANESAFAELGKRIFNSASLSADPIIEGLKKKLGEESKEFKNKFVPVMFEFLYFFIHLANRSAFAQLGAEKSEKLSSQLVEHLIDPTVEFLIGHWPENLKQGIKKDSYNNYNVAESDYAKCKAIFLTPEDDTKIEDKIAAGEKSKSMVGQLVDNVSEIITGKVNISLLFPLQILGSVGSILEKTKKDIDALIPKAAAELECGQRLSALLKDVHDRVGEAPVIVNAENGEVFVHPELDRELEKPGNEGLSDMLRAGACANLRHGAGQPRMSPTVIVD